VFEHDEHRLSRRAERAVRADAGHRQEALTDFRHRYQSTHS
jgi:hypothetical protein